MNKKEKEVYYSWFCDGVIEGDGTYEGHKWGHTEDYCAGCGYLFYVPEIYRMYYCYECYKKQENED